MTGVGALAAWTSPALVVAVVARVTGGGVEAPLFVLAAVAAPLLALLAASRAPSGVAFTAGLVTVACVLGAGFHVISDLGRVQGFEPWTVLGATAALVLVATVWPGSHRVAATAVVLGAAGLVTAAGILGVSVGTSPWAAWSRVASRSAFELGPRSEWTQEGARFAEAITLTFTEPHQVTSVDAGVFRVIERDRSEVVTREWRLAAGESLTLRPGDALSMPAGSRVRFETGKRVPGTPVSGVAWADRAGGRARLVAWWLGLTVTLTGGALVLIRPAAPPSRTAALLGPTTVLAVVLAATSWGVYTVAAAPELSIGSGATASLIRLATIVADEPWRSRLLTASLLALAALFLASALALRRRLADFGAGEAGGVGATTGRRMVTAVTWCGVVAAAAAATALDVDGWSLWLWGVGLAASTLLGPLVATGDTPGGARARARGALAGGLLFALVAAAAHRLAPLHAPLDVAAEFPALVAVPGAWLVTTLSRARGAARGEMVAAARRR